MLQNVSCPVGGDLTEDEDRLTQSWPPPRTCLFPRRPLLLYHTLPSQVMPETSFGCCRPRRNSELSQSPGLNPSSLLPPPRERLRNISQKSTGRLGVGNTHWGLLQVMESQFCHLPLTKGIAAKRWQAVSLRSHHQTLAELAPGFL